MKNSEYQEEKDKISALEMYGTDITILAKEGKLEECFGREEELGQVMEILARRQKNNPVLIGDAGVGKTAIVELFATKMINNLVPFILSDRSIISVDLTKIIAGSRYRGEFESRLQNLVNEVLSVPNIIIFIDEIHNIGGAGSAEGSMDAANILKPILSRSGFQCIGATTTKEYQTIEKDPALNRRFQPVIVKEPTVLQTVNILYGLRASLETFHNVEILPGALHAAASLSKRYIYDRFLPDKAIDLIDRAAAREVIKITSASNNSVVSSIINSAINKIGVLRTEAYRRGDIPTEFIFKEIENAYRKCLIKWIESPKDITIASNKEMSPFSQEFIKKINTSILTHVDEMLFASTKLENIYKNTKKNRNLSLDKNLIIYKEILNSISKKQLNQYSLYRISLYLLTEWLSAYNSKHLLPSLRINYINRFTNYVRKTKVKKYIEYIRYLKPKAFLLLYYSDFLLKDFEIIKFRSTKLSKLDEIRINTVKDFLLKLKPILNKGLINTLIKNSNLELTDLEKNTIYNLLGYYNTETGKNYLTNLEDPYLIKHANIVENILNTKKLISQAEVQKLLSEITGIPIQSLSASESQKLLKLESILHERVIGQEEAISAIAKAIRRARLGIQNPNRPIASFLFCGPTGVGKTEITKTLAVTMFGSENDMIRLDMSEFMEKFTISRLVGSPPGYVGYEDGGQLTDAVRKKPYSVVLFDEIEKAHPDVLNILLQILEDGRLTDSQKRLIPFENTIIIMTSNAGAAEIQELIKNIDSSDEENKTLDLDKKNKYKDEFGNVIEFLQSHINENFLSDIHKQLQKHFKNSLLRTKADGYFKKELDMMRENLVNSAKIKDRSKALKSAVLNKLSTFFLPEFLNRLDDIIIFEPLKPEELRKICDLMIKAVAKRLEQNNIKLDVHTNVKNKLSREGYNPSFGARPLRRLITKHIEDSVSEYILKNPSVTSNKCSIKISLDELDEIIVSI